MAAGLTGMPVNPAAIFKIFPICGYNKGELF